MTGSGPAVATKLLRSASQTLLHKSPSHKSLTSPAATKSVAAPVPESPRPVLADDWDDQKNPPPAAPKPPALPKTILIDIDLPEMQNPDALPPLSFANQNVKSLAELLLISEAEDPKLAEKQATLAFIRTLGVLGAPKLSPTQRTEGGLAHSKSEEELLRHFSDDSLHQASTSSLSHSQSSVSMSSTTHTNTLQPSPSNTTLLSSSHSRASLVPSPSSKCACVRTRFPLVFDQSFQAHGCSYQIWLLLLLLLLLFSLLFLLCLQP
jgi:hypothetical protein